MKHALQILNRYKSFLILLLVLALFGYTGRQVSLVVNSAPDPAYVAEKTKASTAGIVKIDAKTISSLSNLTAVNGNTGVTAAGKPDPFSP